MRFYIFVMLSSEETCNNEINDNRYLNSNIERLKISFITKAIKKK